MANEKEKVLEIGDHVNGMVVFDVDPKNNTAWYAPESLFIGNSTFDDLDKVVKQANAQGLAGQTDWQRITRKAASALTENWDKVAPPAQQGGDAPWFWGGSKSDKNYAVRIYRGGETGRHDDYREESHAVPVFRTGPAIVPVAAVTAVTNTSIPQTSTAIAAAQEAYKIGDRLQEGKMTTIVFGFDKNNNPLRLLDGFAGKGEFDRQDRVIAKANERLGVNSLTRLTDEECAKLAEVWDKVAPPPLQGRHAPAFWGASGHGEIYGRVYQGGETESYLNGRRATRAVPAVIRGPVQK